MYDKFEKNGWQGNIPGQTPGTNAGGTYNNRDGTLPTTDIFGNPINNRILEFKKTPKVDFVPLWRQNGYTPFVAENLPIIEEDEVEFPQLRKSF